MDATTHRTVCVPLRDPLGSRVRAAPLLRSLSVEPAAKRHAGEKAEVCSRASFVRSVDELRLTPLRPTGAGTSVPGGAQLASGHAPSMKTVFRSVRLALPPHSMAQHNAVRIRCYTTGFGLIQNDRLTAAAKQLHPNLLRWQWEVANSHNAARLIVAYSTPNSTPTREEMRLVCRQVVRGDSKALRHSLRSGGIPADFTIDNAFTIDHTGSLLSIAAQRGDVECAAILIRCGASVNRQQTSSGCTALRRAAQGPNTVGVVRKLLKAGASTEIPHRDKSTPLFVAAQHGELAVVAALLEHGAKIDAPMDDGATPLFIAAQQGHDDIVRALLEEGLRSPQGFDINVRLAHGVRPFPLYIAAARNHVAVLKTLLEHGAAVDFTTSDGATALYYAAQLNLLDCVTMLADADATIDAPMLDGSTALLIAAQKGHIDVLRLLIARGADVNVRMIEQHDRTTPLYIAAQQGHTACVEALLEAGAITELTCWRDETALCAAKRKRLGAVVEVLCSQPMTRRSGQHYFKLPLSKSVT